MRILPPGMGGPDHYPWTDDTAMASCVVLCLAEDGEIIQDKLASTFAMEYANDPQRGYGRGTANLLEAISMDGEWRTRSANWWGPGCGSYGNGAAMRVAPLGAFYSDLSTVARQAALQAQVTHDHPEAIAGAVAVAVASSLATYSNFSWEKIIEFTPASELRDKIEQVAKLPATMDHLHVSADYGNGSSVTALDTVPFCLWAARELLNSDEFAEHMTMIAACGGDTDTNCAIIAGICGNKVKPPKEWSDRTEPIRGVSI